MPEEQPVTRVCQCVFVDNVLGCPTEPDSFRRQHDCVGQPMVYSDCKNWTLFLASVRDFWLRFSTSSLLSLISANIHTIADLYNGGTTPSTRRIDVVEMRC